MAHDVVHPRKYRRIGADAHAEREHYRERHARTAGEGSDGTSKVSPKELHVGRYGTIGPGVLRMRAKACEFSVSCDAAGRATGAWAHQ
jgi:hypothetical protein